MGEDFGFCFLIFFSFSFFFFFWISVPCFLSKALEIFLFIYDTPVCGSTDYRSTCLAAMMMSKAL